MTRRRGELLQVVDEAKREVGAAHVVERLRNAIHIVIVRAGRRFVVRRFVVGDLWSDGTGTLLEAVKERPTLQV
jgi:hypothetical protein